jgi:hypothetical protein
LSGGTAYFPLLSCGCVAKRENDGLAKARASSMRAFFVFSATLFPFGRGVVGTTHERWSDFKSCGHTAGVDDWELRADVQADVHKAWNSLTQDNLNQHSDINGYHHDFMNLFGFEFDGVDYDADVEHDLPLPSASGMAPH